MPEAKVEVPTAPSKPSTPAPEVLSPLKDLSNVCPNCGQGTHKDGHLKVRFQSDAVLNGVFFKPGTVAWVPAHVAAGVFASIVEQVK